MDCIAVGSGPALTELIEARVRQSTSNRIRGLLVEEIEGQIVLSGRVPTWYTKQLALHAALELVAGEGLRERIEVRRAEPAGPSPGSVRGASAG